MKSPAFLFYSQDFLIGCSDLTMEERGQYITLLCLQHQKGHLTKKSIDLATPGLSKDVLLKFDIDNEGLFFNKRLDLEADKRQKFSESRIKNLSHMDSHMEAHVENENENEDIDVNKKNKGVPQIE